MKKVLCICIIICGANLLNAKDGKYAWEMSYSTPDFSAAYRPNVYVDFQSTAVHTKQLEIQEHILQRLDWLHLNMDKLANKEMDKLANKELDKHGYREKRPGGWQKCYKECGIEFMKNKKGN